MRTHVHQCCTLLPVAWPHLPIASLWLARAGKLQRHQGCCNDVACGLAVHLREGHHAASGHRHVIAATGNHVQAVGDAPEGPPRTFMYALLAHCGLRHSPTCMGAAPPSHPGGWSGRGLSNASRAVAMAPPAARPSTCGKAIMATAGRGGGGKRAAKGHHRPAVHDVPDGSHTHMHVSVCLLNIVACITSPPR